MAEERSGKRFDENLRIILRDLILRHFNASELKDLYFSLGIDYDLVGESDKGDKTRELLLFVERRGKMEALITVGQASRPDVSWPDISDYIIEDITITADQEVQIPEETPPDPPPPPPFIEVETKAGPLLIRLHGRAGKWDLQLENQGAELLSQVTIIFKSPTTIAAVSPKILEFAGLASGERFLTETQISIRPNQRVHTASFQLKFDVVLQTDGHSKQRHKGILEIPIK